MAQITESPTWGSVYEIASGDPLNGDTTVFSGDDPTAGHLNAQATRLVNRTKVLRHQPVGPRNCLLSGPVDGSHVPNFAVATLLSVDIDDLVLSFSGGDSDIGPIEYHVEQSATITYDFTTPAASADYHQMIAFYDASTEVLSVVSYPMDASTTIWVEDDIEPSHVNNLIWHNPFTGLVQQSDGADWTQVLAVNLGAADTSSGTAVMVLMRYMRVPLFMEPIGSIRQRLSVGTVPSGWFVCNGASLTIGLYKELYDTIGTTYGSGANTFDIPTIGAQSLGNASVDTIIRLI